MTRGAILLAVLALTVAWLRHRKPAQSFLPITPDLDAAPLTEGWPW